MYRGKTVEDPKNLFTPRDRHGKVPPSKVGTPSPETRNHQRRNPRDEINRKSLREGNPSATREITRYEQPRKHMTRCTYAPGEGQRERAIRDHRQEHTKMSSGHSKSKAEPHIKYEEQHGSWQVGATTKGITYPRGGTQALGCGQEGGQQGRAWPAQTEEPERRP